MAAVRLRCLRRRSRKGRRSIGVISTLGAKFAVQRVEVTVFGNEYNVVSVAAWGIDDAVDSKLASLLGVDADVKRIAYGKDAFWAYEAPGALFRDRNAELKDALRKVTAGQRCDLYCWWYRAAVHLDRPISP
jgi:hypothetical protein